MNLDFARTLKRQAETALADPNFDFIATYHAVADLRRLVKQFPEAVDETTIGAVARLLRTAAHENARQAYFLYREAAKVMTDLAVSPATDGLGTTALTSLEGLLRQTSGSAHRGVAEALGGLPVDIAGPGLAPGPVPSPPTVSWRRLLATNGIVCVGTPRYVGRSLVVGTSRPDRILVIKLAKGSDTAAGLAKEIRWMEALRDPAFAVPCRFDIPRPVTLEGRRVFRLDRLPLRPPAGIDRHPDGLAIAYLAHGDYFVYPNDGTLDTASAKEMLGRNAFLLGRLAAGGVIHDAPIPLFHNRTQRLRREDQGRYQWFRAGRLDQWLESCDFPNLGRSGLRDFEHLTTFRGHGRPLYRHVGTHLFSLLLIAGSHFRCRDRTRSGVDDTGRPVDVRDLFDKGALREMIREVFAGYYAGFVERPPAPEPPLDLDRLADRMIEEMGVDRHMTELLRRTDQSGLTDGEFAAFLQSRGYDANHVKGLTRGEKDILIESGPHLGDFNRQISLPEMIECTAAMAAVCISGRFMQKKRTQAGP